MRLTKTKSKSKAKPYLPKTFHLDKRASVIAAAPGSDDELLTTRAAAIWLGVSEQWLSLRRKTGGGPPFERMSTRCVRYRRDKVKRWLDERSFRSVSEYAKGAQRA